MSATNAGPHDVVVTNRYREMAVYDELPPEFRTFFQDACRNYSVIPYAQALVNGGGPVAVLAFARRCEREHRGDGIVRPEHTSC